MVVRTQEERRAKVAGTHVIADGKFQLSVISGVELVTLPRSSGMSSFAVGRVRHVEI